MNSALSFLKRYIIDPVRDYLAEEDRQTRQRQIDVHFPFQVANEHSDFYWSGTLNTSIIPTGLNFDRTLRDIKQNPYCAPIDDKTLQYCIQTANSLASLFRDNSDIFFGHEMIAVKALFDNHSILGAAHIWADNKKPEEQEKVFQNARDAMDASLVSAHLAVEELARKHSKTSPLWTAEKLAYASAVTDLDFDEALEAGMDMQSIALFGHLTEATPPGPLSKKIALEARAGWARSKAAGDNNSGNT